MSSNEFSSMKAITEAEKALIRFFRCMDPEEKFSLLNNALIALAERLSLESHRFDNGDLEEELSWPFEERLLRSFPRYWTDQNLVHLDNVGDCGFWLEEFFDSRTSDLFFSTLINAHFLKETADELSEEYITASDNVGSYLGELEFDGDEEAFQKAIADDFANAIKFWHEQVLSTLEQQKNL